MDRMDAAWELHMRDADPPELAYPCPLCLEDACGCDQGGGTCDAA